MQRLGVWGEQQGSDAAGAESDHRERGRREGQGGDKIPLHIVQGLVGCREYLNFWRCAPQGLWAEEGAGPASVLTDAVWSLQRVQTVGSQSWGTR